MRHLLISTKVLFIFLCSSTSWATPIFEGYYKLSLNNNHIGYVIQRYNLDSQKKTFSSTHYIYLKLAGNTDIESLHAESDLDFTPKSYKYTSMTGKDTLTIDASVKGKKIAIKTIKNGKPLIKEIPLQKNVFLSSFLSHMMLKNEKGIAVNNKYQYSAIAEEEGKVYNGKAWVKEQIKEQGLDCFRVLNTFKGEKFVNYVNSKGESIKTVVPTTQLVAQLMKEPKEAHKGLPFNDKTIKLLFGDVPKGTTNMLSGK